MLTYLIFNLIYLLIMNYYLLWIYGLAFCKYLLGVRFVFKLFRVLLYILKKLLIFLVFILIVTSKAFATTKGVTSTTSLLTKYPTFYSLYVSSLPIINGVDNLDFDKSIGYNNYYMLSNELPYLWERNVQKFVENPSINFNDYISNLPVRIKLCYASLIDVNNTYDYFYKNNRLLLKPIQQKGIHFDIYEYSQNSLNVFEVKRRFTNKIYNSVFLQQNILQPYSSSLILNEKYKLVNNISLVFDLSLIDYVVRKEIKYQVLTLSTSLGIPLTHIRFIDVDPVLESKGLILTYLL